MRMVVATLKEVYAVHKTYLEFQDDNGRQTNEGEMYKVWPLRLTDPEFRHVLLMHARKVIGMIWGRELKGEIGRTFLIEGRYLRRAYRGKFKFSREMVLAQREISRDFQKVLVINSSFSHTIKTKRVVGTILIKR